MGARWTPAKDKILFDNYGKLPRKEMALLVARPLLAVACRLSALGLAKKQLGRRFAGRLYEHNEGFFREPHIVNSYWAGLLAADGYIVGNKVGIDLCTDDENLLQRLAKDINFTGILHRYKYKTAFGIARKSRLTINSRVWVNDLRNNFNIVPRKTFVLKPPVHLDRKCTLAFIAGYLDGDGSVSAHEHNKGYKAIEFRGTKEMLRWIKECFDASVLSEKGRMARITGRPRRWRYRVSGKRATRILKIIQQLKIPRLARKCI